jgi:hypothetical protein
MENKFCKFKDIDNQSYVIVDKNNQPLACRKGVNICYIDNYQKVLDYPAQYNDISESTVYDATNVPCAYESDGNVANLGSIDRNIYNFAIYDSANGPKPAEGNNLDSESVYYGIYAGVMQNGVLNRDELRKIHENAKLLFRQSQIKDTPAPAPAPAPAPSASVKFRKLDDDLSDELLANDANKTQVFYIAFIIGIVLFLLLVIIMAFSS